MPPLSDGYSVGDAPPFLDAAPGDGPPLPGDAVVVDGALPDAGPVVDPGLLIVNLELLSRTLPDGRRIDRLEMDLDGVDLHFVPDDGPGQWLRRDVGRVVSVNLDEWPAPLLLGAFALPEGKVTQVRFLISSLVLLIEGEREVLRVPSAERSGLKIVPAGRPFRITDQQVTGVLARFDPARDIHRTDHGWQTSPVLRADPIPRHAGGSFDPDRLWVKYRPDAAPADVAAFETGIGASLHHEGFGGLRLLTLGGADWARTLELELVFQQSPLVELASIDLIATADQAGPPLLLDDKRFEEQVPILHETRIKETWLEILRQQQRDPFDDPLIGDRGIVVAILDAVGFDLANAELYDNFWVNQGELPAAAQGEDLDGDGVFGLSDINDQTLAGPAQAALIAALGLAPADAPFDGRELLAAVTNGVDDDGNGYADDIFGANVTAARLGESPGGVDSFPNPESDHGTAVASIVGSISDNQTQIAGVIHRVGLMLVVSSQPRGLVDRLEPVERELFEAFGYAAQMAPAIIVNASSAIWLGDPPEVNEQRRKVWGVALRAALAQRPPGAPAPLIVRARSGHGRGIGPPGHIQPGPARARRARLRRHPRPTRGHAELPPTVDERLLEWHLGRRGPGRRYGRPAAPPAWLHRRGSLRRPLRGRGPAPRVGGSLLYRCPGIAA